MNALHPEISNSTPIIAIDDNFKRELLIIASTVTSKEEPKPPSKQFYVDDQIQEHLNTRKSNPRSGLLDLPNEILLSVLEQLEDEVFVLSQLSRRLHHLALPLYLARKGLHPFTGELVLSEERSKEVVNALSAALFRPGLNCICCTFNFYWPDAVVLRNVRGLAGLVDKLGVLREAHLDFSNMRSFNPREREDTIPVRWGVISEARICDAGVLEKVEKVDWARELLELFDKVVTKGCKTLTVCSSGWTARSTARELTVAVQTRGSPSLWRLCSDFLACFWMSSITGLLGLGTTSPRRSGRAKYFGTLETFNLHSAMLLEAKMCPWSIRMLNTSRISSLSLKHLDIDSDAWAIILPAITLPLLRSLSIDMCSLQFPPLADFLGRHTSIETLHLGRSLPDPCSMSHQLASTFLQNLTHLSAPPVYLNHLLNSANAIPSLKSVTIIIRVHYGRYFDFGMLNNTLMPIASRLVHAQYTTSRYPGPPVLLGLDLSFESSSDDWMFFDVGQDTGPTAVVRHISRLEICIWQYRLPTEVITHLPKWMGLFPSLREVDMRSPSKDGPTELEERLNFVSAIFRGCPRLEKLGINGVVEDLDTWRVHQ